ncbi:hypothetical protein A2662_03710 [Candidatus Giovannonibacteria bacterium RIFCSPHIGHO2_01_FULL_45_33]|uniref:Histidine kinase N-terminal 7TM region domain-containing protein n=1 Tax=Candidatus Giovannonibacteria bacterium RIFCSPLOWO2_01_FULL_45_34 TaxID=1798351 RepID=A0A1F5X0W3_9BACT|nr:MAG: hypothetical protein A2662_03710 [Candidatus Giovannonibacteria bacterium RIFCSPHIGHO2_01_FULL_45_33]OGF68804.1 MAG: hypothetical protein A3C73_01935 [Candidatus Giovannonibacteria bacterium RIFCSPHIGHO2_02_FULL_44_11]OGF81211.1 MAG: hypothetical protein A2930_01975 [Candidatus Giovannonibacteria bacterium RIFCSPLOWO2_01_FULL_45_34]
MENKEKTTAYILLFINIAIIAAAELTGEGKLFFESGLVHSIAILFIIGVAMSLFRQYYFADPIFKKFLNACLVAFAVFSASHAFEFFMYRFAGRYEDHVFAVTINFCLMSILIMISGSEIFLRAYFGHKRARFPFLLSNIVIAGIAVFSTLLFFDNVLVSLEPENAAPYLYSLAVLAAAFLLWRRINLLKHSLPQLTGFFKLLACMVVFVALSALSYSLYDIIKEFLGMPDYQIVYLSHFIFYIGMSLVFLAFQRLENVGGGVVDDIKNREIA